MLVGKDNFIKNTFFTFYFHFLSNLERSSFGGLGEKIIRHHHFSPPSSPNQTPIPPIFSFYFLLFFFSFLFFLTLSKIIPIKHTINGFPMILGLPTWHLLDQSPWPNIFFRCWIPWHNVFFFYTNHTNHHTVQNSHSSTTLADLQQNPLHPRQLSSHWWAWMNKLKNLYSSKLRECHCRSHGKAVLIAEGPQRDRIVLFLVLRSTIAIEVSI